MTTATLLVGSGQAAGTGRSAAWYELAARATRGPRGVVRRWPGRRKTLRRAAGPRWLPSSDREPIRPPIPGADLVLPGIDGRVEPDGAVAHHLEPNRLELPRNRSGIPPMTRGGEFSRFGSSPICVNQSMALQIGRIATGQPVSNLRLDLAPRRRLVCHGQQCVGGERQVEPPVAEHDRDGGTVPHWCGTPAELQSSSVVVLSHRQRSHPRVRPFSVGQTDRGVACEAAGTPAGVCAIALAPTGGGGGGGGDSAAAPAAGMSRALLKLSGSLVHDYATIADDSPSPNRASRARRAATSAGIS